MLFRFTTTTSRALRLLPALATALALTLLPATQAGAATPGSNTQPMRFASQAVALSAASSGVGSGAAPKMPY